MPRYVGAGHGNHQLSKLEWNQSPPGRHPRGGLWGFGWGNQGQDVHDGHADTVRQNHASLTELAWPKGWLHLGCILSFAKSSHPLRSLTIYSWYSLRRIVAALDASRTASSVLLIGAKEAVALVMPSQWDSHGIHVLQKRTVVKVFLDGHSDNIRTVSGTLEAYLGIKQSKIFLSDSE